MKPSILTILAHGARIAGAIAASTLLLPVAIVFLCWVLITAIVDAVLFKPGDKA